MPLPMMIDAEECRGRVQVPEGELRHRERNHRAEGGRDAGEGNGPQPAEVDPDREADEHQAGDGHPEDVALDCLAGGNGGGDGAGYLGAHFRVIGAGRVLGDQPVSGRVERFTGVLDEQTPGRKRRDPDVIARGVREYAAREPPVDGVRMDHPLFEIADRLVVVREGNVKRVLALADLGSQSVADRFEIAFRGVEPFVALEEVANVAHVIRGEVHDIRRQGPQLRRQILGVTQVGGPVR